MSKSQFPLRFVHGNLLFGRGDARAAIYRLDTVSYPFLPGADKKRWFQRLARLAASLGTDFSLYRVSRQYPAEDYVAQAEGLLDERRADPDKWQAYLMGHEEHLRGLRPFVPEVYLVVSLAGAHQTGIGGSVMERTGQTRQHIGERFGRGARRLVKKGELEVLDEREDRALARVSGAVGGRRATTREVQWLLRRSACRGLGEPTVDPWWQPAALVVRGNDGQPAFLPQETDIVRHMNAPLREQDRCLPIQSEEGLSFQTMLGVGALPEAATFPGTAELLFTPLERVGFPVDAVVHARWISNKDAVTRVRRRIVDADVAFAGQADSLHGALNWTLEENRSLARDLDAYLTGDAHPPLLDIAMSLAVGAPDREELKRSVDSLRAAYGDVVLHQPLGLQEALFLDHLPRADGGLVRDYADVLTVEQFGALMAVGTHDAGDRRGVLLARTTSYGSRPVRLDITRPPLTHRPPAIYISGGLGSGKTFTAQLICIQAALRGSRVLTVDPKPDHNLENVPELRGMVNVIHPTGREEHRGMLDPLVVSPPHIREDRANSFYAELLGSSDVKWQTQIRKAVKLVLAEEQPCSLRVVDTLLHLDHPDAVAAGEALEVWADSGLARLGFGNGVAHTGSSYPVTTIRPSDLSLPDMSTARSDYDSMERVSVAIMKLIAGFAMRILGDDKTVHKVFLFDEAGALTGNADGRRLVEQINLYGRSKNATALFLMQLHAMGGDLEKLVGARFIFGQETEDEARRGIELVNLDPNDRGLVERVLGYRKGRGLFRDVDGQVAEIQVEPVYPHLLEVLDTSPARGRHEEERHEHR